MQGCHSWWCLAAWPEIIGVCTICEWQMLCLLGILLTKTRLAVSKLVNYVHKQPQLRGRVFADRLVGQGQRDGTMTDTQQENTLRRFRAGCQYCCYFTISWYHSIFSLIWIFCLLYQPVSTYQVINNGTTTDYCLSHLWHSEPPTLRLRPKLHRLKFSLYLLQCWLYNV